MLLGRQKGERQPDALLIVVDASNLDNHLRFALQLIELGLPTVVALNMVDLAKRDGLELDPKRLEAELGVPVIETVAVRKPRHRRASRGARRHAVRAALRPCTSACPTDIDPAAAPGPRHRHRGSGQRKPGPALDPPARRRAAPPGRRPLIILAAIMFVMFQAVFAWSAAPVGWIEDAVAAVSGRRSATCFPTGCCARWSSTACIGGVGAVIVFLPQILILFFFILLLEGTGYMVRAAFLMDQLMHGAGLSGRAFIPLAVELRLRGSGHHGDAHHRRSEGPADDHPRRAADDLLGAAAGLHADHRRLHSRPRGRPGASASRGW